MPRLLNLWLGLLTTLPAGNIAVYNYSVKLIRILLIIVGLILAGQVGNRLISGILRPDRIPGNWGESRIKTMRGLVRSLLRYALYFVGAIMILPTSVLAGAGILGLAIGFGAQSLVKDVITGFFILFEDQFAVGDYVTVSGVTGTVEDIGLRVSKIRESTGELHIVSNGEIRQVTNMARGAMGVLVEVSVPYKQDLDEATAVIEAAAGRVADANRSVVLEDPRVLGVSSFGEAGVILQVFAKVKPMQQWAFGRLLRRAIKEALDAAGIATSSPHL
ncbi:MAG: mechanosensitive ion channel family protein [Thermacetogeniaceae bacterium]